MQWKSWTWGMRRGGSDGTDEASWPRPKDLPAQIGQYLVVQQRLDPDVVWDWKCVLRPRADRRHAFDFRLYDPIQARAAGCNVVHFNSLQSHPELILYAGVYHRDTLVPEFDPPSPQPEVPAVVVNRILGQEETAAHTAEPLMP